MLPIFVTHRTFYHQGGVHFSEGGYGRIAAKLFNTLDVDVFYVGCLQFYAYGNDS